MSIPKTSKEKFIIQLALLIVLCIVFLASFRLIDKLYETKYKMKIAELNLKPYNPLNEEIKQ